MNKFLLSALTAAAISSLSLPTVAADSAQVRFHGRIVNTTCDVTINNSRNSTVELGTYHTSYFTSDDSTTSPVKFDLVLSRCQLVEPTDGNDFQNGEYDAERVVLTFEDNTDSNDARQPGMLTPEEGSADNVGIQVQYLKANGTEGNDADYDNVFQSNATRDIHPSEMKHEVLGTGRKATNTFPMRAYMRPWSADAMPTAGNVNGRMTVTISYH